MKGEAKDDETMHAGGRFGGEVGAPAFPAQVRMHKMIGSLVTRTS